MLERRLGRGGHGRSCDEFALLSQSVYPGIFPEFVTLAPVSIGASLCIGLAKEFVRVFPYHLMGKPKRTLWPTQ